MIIYEKYKDKGAVHWDYFYNKRGNYVEWVNWLISLFPDKGSLIDLGCGDGLWSCLLGMKGLEVLGIDSSEYGVNLAREKAKEFKEKNDSKIVIELIDIDFLSRLFKTHPNLEQINYCLATEIIEHIENQEAIKTIFEKVVSDYMILTTPDKENSKHLGSPYHYKEYTENEMRELFKDYKVERLRNEKLKGEFNTDEDIVLKISKNV